MNSALTQLRRELHQLAERSNSESRTAELLRAQLEGLKPDELWTEVGGHGLVAVFEGSEPGPTVLLRSDMDALPIPESLSLEHGSRDPESSHKCGHDGHMAMMVGLAQGLAAGRPPRGRVLVLFQPAEETGEGALRVLADPRVAGERIDRAIALHNLPGVPLGQVVVRDGPFAAASKGMIVELIGVSSHAAEPHQGVSPVAAAAAIAQFLQSSPQRATALYENVQATVVGIEVGGPAFGTSPGSGRVMATLRAYTEASMTRLSGACEQGVRGIAEAYGLQHEVSWTDDFPATVNDPSVVRVLREAARECGLDLHDAEHPFPWSEDFGHFTQRAAGALFGLGSGEDQPPLHHPDYDFPDELIDVGARLFLAAVPGLLEDPASGG